MMADIWSLVSFYLVLAFQWLQLDVTSAQINQQFYLLSLCLPGCCSRVSHEKAENPPRSPGAQSNLLHCLPLSAVAAQALPSPQPLSHCSPLPLPLPLSLPCCCRAQPRDQLRDAAVGHTEPSVSVQVSQLPQELLSLGSGPHLSCKVFTPRWWECVVLICIWLLWCCLYIHKDW